MRYLTLPVLLALTFLDNCARMSSGRTVVMGVGPGEFLKMRAGPGLGYKGIVGLPDGTPFARGACVTELGQLWCEVLLSDSLRIKRFAFADYLSTD